MSDVIRNPATERADRILALLDNPTQRSTEFGYGIQRTVDAPRRTMADAIAEYEECAERVRAIINQPGENAAVLADRMRALAEPGEHTALVRAEPYERGSAWRWEWNGIDLDGATL